MDSRMLQTPSLRRCDRRLSHAALLLAMVWASAAGACTIPVFRYAMQTWPADAYDLCIFHVNGADTMSVPEIRQLVQHPAEPANVRLTTVNAMQPMPAALARIWAHGGSTPAPWMAARSPAGALVWRGPATAAEAARVLSSPLRKQLSDRLIRGEAAVWILLESGDAAADERAAAVLGDELQRFTAQGHPDSARASMLWPNARFSMLRLDRASPTEAVLVEMLLVTEPDLHELHEPMAIPVFGRGRALYALVGAGISKPNIVEACTFIAGECSCQAKELNPGVDLLLAVDWEQRLEDAAEAATPLTGEFSAQAVPEAGRGAAAGAGTGLLGFLQGTSAGRRLIGVLVAGLLVISAVTWAVMRRGDS
jgi:hypothetical protein